MSRPPFFAAAILIAITLCTFTRSASAVSEGQINARAHVALSKLYESSPMAHQIGAHATGTLVFPNIVQASFPTRHYYGKGALIGQRGGTHGYYYTSATSYGYQPAGPFGFALFLMDRQWMNYFVQQGNCDLADVPGLVTVDVRTAHSSKAATLKNKIYVFFFDQNGPRQGLSLQTSKIRHILP